MNNFKVRELEAKNAELTENNGKLEAKIAELTENNDNSEAGTSQQALNANQQIPRPAGQFKNKEILDNIF